MKSTIAAMAIVLASSFAFAQAPAASEPAPATKMTKAQAKKACKSEGKKGKDLKDCVKEKTM